ncbi:MAG: SH3 domain-containing protein [Candidatus Acidiferrum sp.]
MRHKLLILSSFASLALVASSTAATTPADADSAPVAGALRGTIVCRGVQDVPVTADAEQSLPMQIVARLGCGEQVAVLSDSEGYTVRIGTADGKTGYVAHIYLNEAPASSKDGHAAEAVVDNGIARWQSGAPGSEQFYSDGMLVESLTANGVTVQVALQDTGWKFRASVAIANDGKEQVFYSASRFTLDELKPRLRTLAYQNPKELAKALTHQVYWTNASATAPASAVYKTASYKPAAYVATPNYLALEAQQPQAVALQSGMVAPKEKTSGVVWFERDKNPQQLNLRIFVGDQIFEFPLSFPAHN